ncbi:MAG: hypothetical protein IT211_01730 [Armatimonadetes bacterium]|nr:hypothetical protein [Armatimonadota bacterium]
MDPFKKSLGINFGPLFSASSRSRNEKGEQSGPELFKSKARPIGPKPAITTLGGFEVIDWEWVSTSSPLGPSGYWRPELGDFVGWLPDPLPVGIGSGGSGITQNDPPKNDPQDKQDEEPLPFLEYCRCKMVRTGPGADTRNCCSEEQQKKIEDAYKGIMRPSSSIRSDLSKYRGLIECITKTFGENKICCLDPDNRDDANRYDGQSKYLDMDIWVNPSTKEIMIGMSSAASVVDYLEKLLFAMVYYCSIKDSENSTNDQAGAIIDAVGIVGQITGRYMSSKHFISVMYQLGQVMSGNGFNILGKWVWFYEGWGTFFNKDDYNKKFRNNNDRLYVFIETEIGGFSDWPITKEQKKKRERYIKNILK